jgi:hypothetical protein
MPGELQIAIAKNSDYFFIGECEKNSFESRRRERNLIYLITSQNTSIFSITLNRILNTSLIVVGRFELNLLTKQRVINGFEETIIEKYQGKNLKLSYTIELIDFCA